MRHPSRSSFTRPVLLAAALAALLALPAGAAVRLGTLAGETLTGTHRADTITGAGGDDTVRGLAGDDTYVFADGWGDDTLEEKLTYRVGGERVAGGTDTLVFAGVENGGVSVYLIPQWRGVVPLYNQASELDGDDAVVLGASIVENVVGTGRPDVLAGGRGANRLATGGGAGDLLIDAGGYDDGPGGVPALAPSNDTFAGVAANTGTVIIRDWGGSADVLDLRPLRSGDVVLNRIECDGDEVKECLQVVTGTGDGQVVVQGQFGAYDDLTVTSGQQGRIETLRFADRTVSFDNKDRSARGGGDDSLLGKVETKRQQELAERAPALAEAARRQAREPPAPGDGAGS